MNPLLPWWHQEAAPPEAISKLAGETELTAYHEAGHAVVIAVTGRPLRYVQVRYQARRRSGAVDWRVQGRTATSMFVPDAALVDAAVVALAGPEAEARRISELRNLPLPITRAMVLEENPHDTGQADRLLRTARTDRSAAAARAEEIIGRHWDGLTVIVGSIVSGARSGKRVPARTVREMARNGHAEAIRDPADAQMECGTEGDRL